MSPRASVRRPAHSRTRPPGSRGHMTGTGIPGRKMAPLGGSPVLGDGWTQEGPNTFLYNSAVEVNAVLSFGPVTVGRQYRVVTNCSELTGTLPRIDVAIGAQAYYSITAIGLYDFTTKAPALSTELTFTINTNATTLRAVLKAIYVVEV